MGGKTYVGTGSSKVPKKIYYGNASNQSKKVLKIYVGNANGKSVRVWPNALLPSAYQQVEYILNSNHSQWIDTGIVPNSDTMIGIEFIVNKYYPDTPFARYSGYGLFGNFEDYSNGEYYVDIIPDNYPASTLANGYWDIVLRFGPYRHNGAQILFDSVLVNRIPLNTKYIFECNLSGGVFKVNGTTNLTSTNTFGNVGDSSYTMPLFGIRNNRGVNITQTEIKLYHFWVSQNGNPVRDMYPCYRISDNKIGLYDTVGKTFYTNAGTGTFYKGPNV